METTVNEINDGIYRLSTYLPDMDFMFNQFLVDADEPLLFHTGPRQLFPLVSAAAAGVVSLDRLRWISYGHFEADECGSLNEWLAVAPNAQATQGALGVMVSLADFADRPPRGLAGGEVLDLGGKRLRWIETPHVPHGWDAGVLFEETTATVLCGDLFTATGASSALTDSDIVGPAEAAENMFGATCLTPNTGATIRALADLTPSTLGLMHGPSFNGDCVGALKSLAEVYEARLTA
jgi:flavorubredoxin